MAERDACPQRSAPEEPLQAHGDDPPSTVASTLATEIAEEKNLYHPTEWMGNVAHTDGWIAVPGNTTRVEGLTAPGDGPMHTTGVQEPTGPKGIPGTSMGPKQPYQATDKNQGQISRPEAEDDGGICPEKGQPLKKNAEPSTDGTCREARNAEDARFLTQLRKGLKDKEEARRCVAIYKAEFTCTCGGRLRGDGTAKNSYRLMCKLCRAKTSFGIVASKLMQASTAPNIRWDKTPKRGPSKRLVSEVGGEYTDADTHIGSDMESDTDNDMDTEVDAVMTGGRADSGLDGLDGSARAATNDKMSTAPETDTEITIGKLWEEMMHQRDQLERNRGSMVAMEKTISDLRLESADLKRTMMELGAEMTELREEKMERESGARPMRTAHQDPAPRVQDNLERERPKLNEWTTAGRKKGGQGKVGGYRADSTAEARPGSQLTPLTLAARTEAVNPTTARAGTMVALSPAQGVPRTPYNAVAAATAPKSGPGETRGSQGARKLSPEELSRAFQGKPAKAPREVVAVHARGIHAQQVRGLKKLLKENCGISMRNLLEISFIGKKRTEFHVYMDYAAEFKGRILASCPDVEFDENLDPLDDSLLEHTVAEDRILEAAKRYHQRLSRRVTETPVTAHRKFLETGMSRASAVINHRTGRRTATEVEEQAVASTRMEATIEATAGTTTTAGTDGDTADNDVTMTDDGPSTVPAGEEQQPHQ